MLNLRFLPYHTWPELPTGSRRVDACHTNHLLLLEDLESEMSYLKARQVVVSTGHRQEDVGRDGMLRAHPRLPRHPGVILQFLSIYGPLSFSSDCYVTWQANLRAIQRTLVALRTLEESGATRGGQQYRGFLAAVGRAGAVPCTPSSNADPRIHAAQTLLAAGGYEATPASAAILLADQELRRSVYSTAVFKTHPDHGGNDEAFMSVRRAKIRLDRSDQPVQSTRLTRSRA